jgi:hypothetical protein
MKKCSIETMKKIFNNETKAQRYVLFILAALLAGDICIFVKKYLSPDSAASLSMPQDMHVKNSKLQALNVNARSRTAKSGYAYYRFTDAQQKNLRRFYGQNGDAAVVIRVSVKQGKKYRTLAEKGELPFMYSFLYSSDFENNGQLKKTISKRPVITANLSELSDFELSLALGKEQTAGGMYPQGMFIYASSPVLLSGAAVRNAAVGFNCEGSVPFFGFTPAGGNAELNGASADFSQCTDVFRTENSPQGVMPEIRISFGSADGYGTYEAPVKSVVAIGGEELYVYRARDENICAVSAAALLNPFAQVSVRNESAASVTSVIMTHSSRKLAVKAGEDTLVPYSTDPGLIQNWPRKNWRCGDYELFEWDRFPGVLFFDIKDYDIQNDFFRRLAYYAEKTGYRGTLVSDEVLADKHGYNAHDYSAETLASFYTKAADESFQLNKKENLLREILLANGVIVRSGKKFKPGKGAVISISQESAPWLRDRFVAHEGWHGIFFTDENFRKKTAEIFSTMDPQSREFLLEYWHTQSDLDYDRSDEYLVRNEFMAYLMQQPLSNTSDYFLHLANRGSVMKGIPELAAYVRDNDGKQFEDTARLFEEYAFSRWGLACGRVSLVRR